MKILFATLLILHSIIHLLGFIKAFRPQYISQLSRNISRPEGGVWALAFILLLAGGILYLQNNELWPAVTIGGVILSQVLITLNWEDARFGTFANLIILGVAITAQGSFRFTQQNSKEISSVMSVQKRLAENKDPDSLPPIVQKWLKASGALQRTIIPIVKLQQQGEMRTGTQGKWMPFTAVQYFNTLCPSFLWTTRVTAFPLVYLDGRDKLQNGKGAMNIKLLSLINLVDEKENEKINSGSKIRFLGEMCWFPFAALEPYVDWISVTNTKVKAILHQGELPVEGIFEFSPEGRLLSFQAQRYFGGEKDAKIQTWRIDILDHDTFDGFTVPSKCKVTWKLPEGDFHWLTLKVTDIKYYPV